MPRRLGRKLMLSITVIVIIVAAVSGLVNIKTEEQQLLDTMVLGADQLSKGITSATWQFMLDDHREAAYEVMKTIALKQGIDRIRMFNRAGQVTFSTRPDDPQPPTPLQGDVAQRIRLRRGSDGARRLEMLTPIYNEPSCSQAACHAHPPGDRVLGVLDGVAQLRHAHRVHRGLAHPVEQLGGAAQPFHRHRHLTGGQLLGGGAELGAEFLQQ